MLVDALLYHGEEAALEIRLNTMQADVTVIMEGDRTFQGTPYSPTLRMLPQFAKFNIDHQVVELNPDGSPWDQRGRASQQIRGVRTSYVQRTRVPE